MVPSPDPQLTDDKLGRPDSQPTNVERLDAWRVAALHRRPDIPIQPKLSPSAPNAFSVREGQRRQRSSGIARLCQRALLRFTRRSICPNLCMFRWSAPPYLGLASNGPNMDPELSGDQFCGALYPLFVSFVCPSSPSWFPATPAHKKNPGRSRGSLHLHEQASASSTARW